MNSLTITPTHTDDQVLEFIHGQMAVGNTVEVLASEPFVSPTEVAQMTGTSRSFIMNKINDGTIRYAKKGNRYRISLDEVKKFRNWLAKDLTSAMATELDAEFDD